MRKLLVLCTLMIFYGCGYLPDLPPEKFEIEKIDNVVRVFMHTPISYSALVENPQTGLSTLRTFLGIDDLKVYQDVPSNQKRYIVYKKGSNYHEIELHLHSYNDLGGGGWSSTGSKGQSGSSGMTNVIQ